jgi:ribonuclease Y
MTLGIALLLAGIAGILGVALGYYVRLMLALNKKGSVELSLRKLELEAKEHAQKIQKEAEEKAQQILREARAENREKEEKNKKAEERIIKKEEFLDKRQIDIDSEVEHIKLKAAEIKSIKEKADSLLIAREKELEKVARLSETDAKKELFDLISKRCEEDLLVSMQKLEKFGEEKLEAKARDILAISIQRLATSVASEMLTTSVPIPSDDVKGKIIGKEGRNIKAFERATGVELIIDDTPGAITISSFDPVRRQIAKVALETLIADGRIQPAKIEETVEKVKADTNVLIKKKGEEAAFETGVINLDPRVLAVLGRLHFRTSYGQNVLQHSIEMTHIAGMLAEELGANVAVAKAGALLHDIGKALDHEVAGTHVEIGRRILQKFGVSEEVVKAMQAHHEEYPYETVESIIVQTADQISGGRPGARRDSVENYLKRLADLEAISNGFEGVEKSYALQAGREIRVFVYPEKISDLKAKEMARDIAMKIEHDLKYPGEIKINIIRESRFVEFAR